LIAPSKQSAFFSMEPSCPNGAVKPEIDPHQGPSKYQSLQHAGGPDDECGEVAGPLVWRLPEENDSQPRTSVGGFQDGQCGQQKSTAGSIAHSLPARDPSRISQLSLGELSTLREDALDAALSAVTSCKPATPNSSAVGMVPPLNLTPPDDIGMEVFEMHSSRESNSRSRPMDDCSSVGIMGGMFASPGMLDRPGAPCEVAFAKPSPRSMHGAGSKPLVVGFLGQGPFWTCGSTPICRGQQHRRGDKYAATPCRSTTPMGAGPFDLTSQISAAIKNCIELISNAIDVTVDTSPPEEELTTVAMETFEQRLQWRDFLSEAVSKSRASALFASYDVDAEPPPYARPPLSLPGKVAPMQAIRAGIAQSTTMGPSNSLIVPQRTGIVVPHIVAPRGAGWSPLGRPKEAHSAHAQPPGRLQSSIESAPMWISGRNEPKALNSPDRGGEGCERPVVSKLKLTDVVRFPGEPKPV